MSETWKASRDSLQRLREALHEADDDIRHRFAFWVVGMLSMGAAIIAQFGWSGFSFCLGFILWAVGNQK